MSKVGHDGPNDSPALACPDRNHVPGGAERGFADRSVARNHISEPAGRATGFGGEPAYCALSSSGRGDSAREIRLPCFTQSPLQKKIVHTRSISRGEAHHSGGRARTANLGGSPLVRAWKAPQGGLASTFLRSGSRRCRKYVACSHDSRTLGYQKNEPLEDTTSAGSRRDSPVSSKHELAGPPQCRSAPLLVSRLSPGCLQANELMASVASLPRLGLTQAPCSNERTVNDVLTIAHNKTEKCHLIPR